MTLYIILLILIPVSYSGKNSREKTFTNFTILEPPRKLHVSSRNCRHVISAYIMTGLALHESFSCKMLFSYRYVKVFSCSGNIHVDKIHVHYMYGLLCSQYYSNTRSNDSSLVPQAPICSCETVKNKRPGICQNYRQILMHCIIQQYE